MMRSEGRVDGEGKPSVFANEFRRPYGTLAPFGRLPSVETLGYFQMSLRDKVQPEHLIAPAAILVRALLQQGVAEARKFR